MIFEVVVKLWNSLSLIYLFTHPSYRQGVRKTNSWPVLGQQRQLRFGARSKL